MSCRVDHRHSLDLLWLWHMLAAEAPIRPLAQELPYAIGAALKRQKQNKQNKTKQNKTPKNKREREEEEVEKRYMEMALLL